MIGYVFGVLKTPRAFLYGIITFVIFVASATTCYILYPDWMWMYFADPAPISPLVTALLVFPLYLLPFISGFWLSKWTRATKAWVPILCVLAAAQIVEFVLLLERYNTVSSYLEYHKGVRILFHTTPLAYILTGLSVLVIGSAIILLIKGSRESTTNPVK